MVIGRSFEDGLRELETFVHEVGGNRIGPPEVRPDAVHVPLTARDGERYVLRMVIAPERYLTAPPRCTFVTADGQPGPSAWPAPDPRGPFRSPDFICTSPTAEYHRVHPEHPYHPGDGSLVAVVGAVFVALHGPGYAGRWSGRRR